MAEGLNILVWQALVIFQILAWQTMADNSRYLKNWYCSCHTLPPGSATPGHAASDTLYGAITLTALYALLARRFSSSWEAGTS